MSTPLTIYTTPPQREHKAAEECRRDGIRAYLPGSRLARQAFGRIRKPLMPGYVIATDKPYDAVYVRQKVGVVDRGQVKELLLTARVRQRQPRAENPYKAGDHVVITKGSFTDIKATILETRGRMCLVAHEMFRKQHTQAISYTQLRPG